jgi:glycerate dehydrogenase
MKVKITLVDLNTVSNGDIDFDGLKRLGDVTAYGVLSPEELAEATKESEVLLVNKAEVSRRLLEQCHRLKYVGTFSTGYNNVDLAACRDYGVTACNVPDYSTHAVSQHVFALLLQFFGKTDLYTNSVKRGDWVNSKTFCYMPWQTSELFGKTFGVFGYGNIGKATAKISEAFGMNVLVHSAHRHPDCPYPQVDEEELFKSCDILSLHCPLNEQTKTIVNERTLTLMKKSAVLVNTARGGLIDEEALSVALKEGKIAGACLDVLTKEPMQKDNPLFNAPNCLITPHVAWIPQETRQRLADIVAQNLEMFLKGTPQNVIT